VPHKDHSFSERYGGNNNNIPIDKEGDSEDLDEFEDEVHSPVRNKQQYHD